MIAFTVSLATFMEVMDVSIANVSLRHIAGSMAASLDESTWVLTSYLVSNAIVLPLSGWLSNVMGRKRFYMTCVAIFTVSSFLCGIAPSLGILLFFRVLQGAGGGGLAPSEQAILADTFSAAQRGMAFAMYGVAVVVAPAIGPALGGWITDNFSWRWIFFINLPFGCLSLVLTYLLVEDSPAAKEEHRNTLRSGLKVDYVGFALIALGIGVLQIVLDKGQEDDWFGSRFIVFCSILAGVALLSGCLWELFIAEQPVVDLALFKNPTFAFTNFMMFALGFILLASTQLLPQFVQQLLGYDATKAGLLLMPGGFFIMALMPLVGFLVRKVQPKWLIAFGFLVSAGALWHLAGFTTTLSFGHIAWARLYQAGGLAFLFVPINTLAYANLPRGKSNAASAMINFMRNLGGSVGISIATTLLVRRAQTHQTYLGAHLQSTTPAFQDAVHHAAQRFFHLGLDPLAASHRALAVLGQQLQQQAIMLAYLDIFRVLIVACLCTLVTTFFLRRIDLSKAQAGH
jgi:DHA2 family multidrug resistance protein